MSLTVDKCLQAWTNSLRQMNAKADIVFFGDSLIYYGSFANLFPDKVVCNLGLRGDTIHGMIERVEQVKLLAPTQVYLMAGINDVAYNDMCEFMKQFNQLVFSIINYSPGAELILQSLLPVNDVDFMVSCNNRQIIACNEVIRKISYKFHLSYLDLFSLYEENGVLSKDRTTDGIHLTSKAYTQWYDYVLAFNN